MSGSKISKKIFAYLCILTVSIVLIVLAFYALIIPFLVSNKKVLNYTEKQVLKYTGADLEIVEPQLKTGLSGDIEFCVKQVSLRNDNEDLFIIKDFETEVSLKKLLKKTLILKKIGLDYLFADVDKITALLPYHKKDEEKNSSSEFSVDALNSLMYIKKCEILTSLTNEAKAKITGTNIFIEDKRNPKYVRFHIDTVITKHNRDLKISLDDNDKFFINNKKLIIKECPLDINDSRIYIFSVAKDDKFTVSLKSDNFNLRDGAMLLGSNVFINNGSDMIAETKYINGFADFVINMNNKGMNGDINIRDASFKLKSLADMPVYATSGKINITPSRVTLADFEGYYGGSKTNRLSMTGTIDDYEKSVDTKVVIRTVMTDDFTRNYLTKIAGCPISMTGEEPAVARIEVYSKYNKIDVVYMAKLSAGNDILLDGASLSPTGYDRAIIANLHLNDNILNIETIKYYIAQEINKHSKIKPLLTIHGNVDLANNSKILNLGFDVPNPLPSEFLNVLIGQKLFKKGLISGNLEWIDTGKTPILSGTLTAEKVIVPSQRLFIRNGSFTTDNSRLYISSDGKLGRAEYKLEGNIINEMVFPIIVKNIDLAIDNINLEKMLESAVAPPLAEIDVQKAEAAFIESTQSNIEISEDEAMPQFIPGIIAVEKASLEIKKGKYKEIEFGNLKAEASLDSAGNLKIDSNKFDFAEGHSSGKIRCDLANNKFNILLGAKNINSDTIASALLSLKREITGKASGIIDISTDETLKLNGRMKFDILDGTIEKVGLVEYALNFVSIFRNPMAMVSPSVIFDFVNIPEGRFDKISGTLEIDDNVVRKINIQSTAPQLATLIMGRFDLESRDASLRIYTKFTNKNRGLAGILRKLSLSSLANRVSFSSESVENYYAAELELIPKLDADEKDCQVFLTTVDGDVENLNFLSALKKIK